MKLNCESIIRSSGCPLTLRIYFFLNQAWVYVSPHRIDFTQRLRLCLDLYSLKCLFVISAHSRCLINICSFGLPWHASIIFPRSLNFLPTLIFLKIKQGLFIIIKVLRLFMTIDLLFYYSSEHLPLLFLVKCYLPGTKSLSVILAKECVFSRECN